MTQYDTGAVAPVDGDSTATGSTAAAPAVDLSPGSATGHAPSRLGFLARRPILGGIALSVIALAATGAFLVATGGGNEEPAPAGTGPAQVGATAHDPGSTVSGTPAHRRTPIRRVSPSSS